MEMYFGRPRFFHFGMGFRPFGFYFWGPGFFSLRREREEYLRMLERYREDLQEELKAVEREIEELRKELAGE
jgi:hypothetical protein